MATSLHPTLQKERIQSLDVLRGVAILGILIMNIQSFAMPGSAYLNPTSFGDLEGINYWVWMLSHLFADQKFMSIFSILYGAGIILITQKTEQRDGTSTALHYKRTFWLLFIGMLHAYLIWYGDILVAYAICALFVYLFRKWKPRKLCIVGFLTLSVHSIIYLFFGFSLPFMPVEVLQELSTSIWSPGQEQIAQEISAITGTLIQQISYVAKASIEMQGSVFLMWMMWRAGGLMLIGMALYKWGILSAKRDTSFYKKGMIIGFVVGLPIVVWGVIKNFESNWSFEYSMFLGSQFNYYGSIPISFAYICGVMLFVKSKRFLGIKKNFAAIGQMALTNYLAQSIICVFIFYGMGLGFFGTFERYEQCFIIMGIWILQILWSKLWLASFRFGPFEWVWRSLTYFKFQPMKK